MKKRIFALLLVLALALSLGACGGTANPTPSADPGTPSSKPSTPPTGTSTGTSTPAPGKEVKYAETIEMLSESGVASISPFGPGATGGSYRMIYSCVYDRLLAYTEKGEIIPELALSWDTKDSKTYTFKLRNDVYFSNGEKFTAQSVVDTWEIGKAAAGSLAIDTWRLVEKATAIDENTVELTLATVNVDFIYFLTLPGGSIVNKKEIEKDPIKGAWIGTGAFIVTDFVSSDRTVLTRNDDYWGTPAITKEIIVRWVPEVAARTIKLKNNESQLSFNTAPQDLEMFQKDENYQVIDFISNATNSIGFNMTHPICGDINFRKAVAYAINRQEIAAVASGKWAIPAEDDGTFWGYGTEFRNSDIKLIPQDLDLAKEYLAKSPYKGEEIELISGNPDTNKGAEMIKEQLGKIGINLKLFQTDNATLGTYAKYADNKAQMVHYVNGINNSASSVRSVLYPNGAGNRSSYSNTKINELLDKAPTVADATERAKLYKEIQAIVAEDLPYINVYYAIRTIVTAKGLGGIVLNPDLNHGFRGVYLELDD